MKSMSISPSTIVLTLPMELTVMGKKPITPITMGMMSFLRMVFYWNWAHEEGCQCRRQPSFARDET
jgi:hypothetical protein